MKNCTINVTTADTNDDEMTPLGKGGSMSLLRMTLGQESKGGITRTWVNNASQRQRTLGFA